ncbi:cytochrome C [Skermanella stibiiresistens SB22]|uniref:Cytochrome C n=1 Tax=Skermanella stibiiresistens SB22 TaxID=1385369 RepID=W9H4R5_9PROT|nr:c-type cytochrome [Skermanella stibiiresistens]EWY41049.1 cytochrome C [Skermanella stibiiresistens SB22]
MNLSFLTRVAAAGAAFFLLAAGTSHAQDAEETTDPYDKPYIVEDGKVDQGTYNGYRRYHSSCHVCHGPDGLGGSFAPSLVESLKFIDYDKFAETIANGKAEKGSSGQRVMPSFGTDQNVMLYINDIYGYLKARSDGKIDRGRPERIKK